MTNIQVKYANQQPHQLIEIEGQRVLTTAQLAQSYGTSEKLIRQNFGNNKARYKEGKHCILLRGDKLRTFKRDFENLGFAPNLNKLYLWTEKGALLHAKSLNTGRAWEAYEMLVDEYYRLVKHVQKLDTPLPADPIALALQAALDTRQEVQDIKQDVQELKDSMRINTHQEKQLQDMAKQRVLKALGGYNSPAYKAMSKKVFPTVWRDFKNKFDLPTYRALQAKQFEEAKFFLSIWEPSSSMRYDIAVHNRQLQLAVFNQTNS